MTFTVKKLSVDHAAEWQSLKFECVNSFPLGFLITPEEALETTQDRARSILSSGSTRGIFDHERFLYQPYLSELLNLLFLLGTVFTC